MPRQISPNDSRGQMTVYFKEENRLRDKSSFRLLLLSGFFASCFFLIVIKLTIIAGSDGTVNSGYNKKISEYESRQDIVDRNGNILATNIPVYSLYAHPEKLLDPEFAAKNLSLIFPDHDENKLLKLFKEHPKFVFLKKSITNNEKSQVLELGEPGLRFGERELRIYPNGSLLSHVLGRTKIKEISTTESSIEGISGLEKMFNNQLIKKGLDKNPLKLSIDLATQSVLEDILSDGTNFFNAKGGSGIIMDVNNGEVLAMVSLPNFDPNLRVKLNYSSENNDMFLNKAVQGTYELGSVLKIFTAAMAIEMGTFSPHTLVDVSQPVKIGKTNPIKDKNWIGDKISLKEVIVKSSNVGSARIISSFEPEEQKKFLESFGFFEETGLELPEANIRSSVGSDPWTRYKAAMIAIGHGIRVSPLHLAAAYATSINGGLKVTPTILRSSKNNNNRTRIISHSTSTKLREIMGEVVNSGTGKNAKIDGYSLGGKTGTAEKYDKRIKKFNYKKNYASFASFFPLHDPKYVVVICLDEASNSYKKTNKRIAGNTAVPLTAEIISRVAPILGVKPEMIDSGSLYDFRVDFISDKGRLSEN